MKKFFLIIMISFICIGCTKQREVKKQTVAPTSESQKVTEKVTEKVVEKKVWNDKLMLIPFEQDGKIGFINEKFEVVFPPEYTKIFNQSKYMFYVFESLGGTYLQKFEILFSNGDKKTFANDVYVAFIGDKYYVCSDLSRSIVYDRKTHDIIKKIGYQVHDTPSEKYIFITNVNNSNKSRYFYIDLEGNEYLYDNPYNRRLSYDFDSKSIICFNEDWDKIIIDFEGKPKFDKLFFDLGSIGDGLFIGYAKDEQGYFNLNGELIIPIKGLQGKELNSCPIFCHSLIPCVLNGDNIYVQEEIMENKSKNWAIINSEGNIVKKNIDADFIFSYSKDGVAIMYKKTDEKKEYSLLDTSGNIITTRKYDSIKEPINGYARARYNNVDYLISTKDGQEFNVSNF